METYKIKDGQVGLIFEDGTMCRCSSEDLKTAISEYMVKEAGLSSHVFEAEMPKRESDIILYHNSITKQFIRTSK